MYWQFLNSKEGLSNGQMLDQGIGMGRRRGLPVSGSKYLSAAHPGKGGQVYFTFPSTPVQCMCLTHTPVVSTHAPLMLTLTVHACTCTYFVYTHTTLKNTYFPAGQ